MIVEENPAAVYFRVTLEDDIYVQAVPCSCQTCSSTFVGYTSKLVITFIYIKLQGIPCFAVE